MSRRAWIVLGVVFLLTEIAGFMGEHHVPGFYAVFGFVGSAVFILVAKGVGKRFLMRKETEDDA